LDIYLSFGRRGTDLASSGYSCRDVSHIYFVLSSSTKDMYHESDETEAVGVVVLEWDSPRSESQPLQS
jgi:hypothetical protein